MYTFDEEQWKSYKALLSQLVKFVFFGDERVYGIDMEDMMGDVSKYQEEDEFAMLMNAMGSGEEGESGATLESFMKMI